MNYAQQLASRNIKPYFIQKDVHCWVVRKWVAAGRSAMVGEYGYPQPDVAKAKADSLNLRYGV